jgi:AcrR family transcriptional regulator
MSDDDQKSPRGRPRTMDADQVLETAMNAYWREDPVDVSLNAICQMAGVSKPSVYRAFGSEDGLMEAVLDRYAERLQAVLESMLARGDGLTETLAALVDFAADAPDMATGCVYHKMLAARHRLGPQTRAKVDAIEAGTQAAFAAFFAARRAAGDGARDLPDAVAARFLADQIGLALGQRAAGLPGAQIRTTLTLALSVLDPRLPGDAPRG